MINPPFRLLTLATARPLWLHCAARDAHVAAFKLPGVAEPLYGLPAATESGAVHNLFAAESGRSIAEPYAHNFVPLSEATLGLCRNVLGLIGGEAHLSSHPATFREEWGLIEALEDVKNFFASFQGVVACAHEITKLLDAHAADRDAYTMRDHPLTSYAQFTSLMAMLWCVMTAERSGIPGAITMNGAGGFAVNFDPDDRHWSTQQAAIWWAARDARLQRLMEHSHQLKATAPSEAEVTRMVDEILSKSADIYAKQTGKPIPAGLH